jgi:hypothetical protein
VLSVVIFFETTEFIEGELHQTGSANIFLCVLRGYLFFETTENQKWLEYLLSEHGFYKMVEDYKEHSRK